MFLQQIYLHINNIYSKNKIQILFIFIRTVIVHISQLIIKITFMHFESITHKKQGIIESNPHHYQLRQGHISNIPIPNSQSRANHLYNSQNIDIFEVKRSRSTKDFQNFNPLKHCPKHPILTKQKPFLHGPELLQTIGNFKNPNNFTLSSPNNTNININSHITNSNLYLNDLQDNLVKGNQHSNINIKTRMSNPSGECLTHIKTLKKGQNSHQKLTAIPHKQQSHFGLTSYQSMQMKPKSIQNNYNQNSFNTIKTNEKFGGGDTQLKRYRSGENIFTISPFVQRTNQYIEQNAMKTSYIDLNSQLKTTIKNLQKQLKIFNKEREKDKGKLLQYSIDNDKLKFENEFLKNALKKQSLELKKIMREEQKEMKQTFSQSKQKQVSKLNQAMVLSNEKQINRQQKLQKNSKSKIKTLLVQAKEKKNQNIGYIEKINLLSKNNKELEKKNEIFKQKLENKQKQVNGLQTRLNQLKQSLQTLKIDEMQKQEMDLSNDEFKTGAFLQSKNQMKQLQTKIKQKEQLILSLLKDNQNKSQMMKHLKQQFNVLKTINQNRSHTNDELIRKLEFEEKNHEKIVNDKNNVIQTISKNIDKVSYEMDNMKKEKQTIESLLSKTKQDLETERRNSTKILQQSSTYKQKLNILSNRLQEKQKQLHEFTQNTAKYSFQLLSKQQEINTLTLQKMKCTQDKIGKQTQVVKVRHECCQLLKQNLILKQEKNELKKSIHNNQDEYRNLSKEMESIKKSLLQYKNKCQYQSLELQIKQKALDEKIIKNRILSEEVSRLVLKSYEKQLEMNQIKPALLDQNQDQERASTSCSVTGSFESMQSTNVSSQLEIKICAILGISATNNIDKIVRTIQEMIKNKKYLQGSTKNYEQLLKILEIKQGQQYKLVSEIRMYKSNYPRLTQLNQRQEHELKALKQQNSGEMSKNEELNLLIKKLQNSLQYSNQTLMKISLKYINEKLNVGGRKY